MHLRLGIRRREGQRLGHRSLTDAALLEALVPNLAPTSRWCATTKQPLRTLMGSKRDIYASTVVIHTAISYRRFCQRLRLAKLGIGVGSKRVDACDYCTWFDREVRPAMKASLADFQMNINRLDAAVLDCLGRPAPHHRRLRLRRLHRFSVAHVR